MSEPEFLTEGELRNSKGQQLLSFARLGSCLTTLGRASPFCTSRGFDAPTLSSFAAQFSCFHQLFIRPSNDISSDLQRVGEFPFAWQKGTYSERAAFDQIVKLFPDLSRHRFRAFSIDANIYFRRHVRHSLESYYAVGVWTDSKQRPI